jgi:transcriptional regulator with XRE-family HTH domain
VPKSVFTEKYERFRKMLIEARHKKNLTQAQVAMKLKRPQSYVSKYELGERRLDVVEFLEVATVLGLDACSFLNELQATERGKPDGRRAKKS